MFGVGVPRRWGVVVVLAAAASTLTDFHIFAFGAVLPDVEAEFALSEVQRGLLSGLALLTIAVLRFPAGIVVDRIGPRYALALGLIAIGVGEIVGGLSRGVPMLAAGQVVSGYGMAQSVVSGQPLIGRSLPPSLHGKGMGIFNFGFGLGALLGFLVAPLLVDLMSWRFAFRALGTSVAAIGLAAALISTEESGVAPRERRSGRAIFSDARVWYLSLHMAAVFGVFVATATWIPAVVGMRSVALWLAAAFPLGYMLGSISAGRMIGLLSPAVLVWVGPLLAALPLALVPWWGLSSTVVGSLIGGAFMALALAGRDTKVAEFWASGGMGMAYGTITAIGAIGAFLCPVLAGYVLEVTGSFAAVFGVLGMVLLLAVPVGNRAMRVSWRGESIQGRL